MGGCGGVPAGVAAAAGGGVDVDVVGEAGVSGDAEVQAAECRGFGGDGDVDAAGALHVDEQNVAGFPGFVDDFLERGVPVNALLQVPSGVDLGEFHARFGELGGQRLDLVVGVDQDDLRLAGAVGLHVAGV